MYPVIDGSHGPRRPRCAGSGIVGGLADGPLVGKSPPSAWLLVGVGVCVVAATGTWFEAAAAAVDDDGRMRATHGFAGEFRACFGMDGIGFGMAGPFPRVRLHRCA